MNPTQNKSLNFALNELPHKIDPTTMSSQSISGYSDTKRTQPIPPPSHPRQYRAIGLIKAKYKSNEDKLTQGSLITSDGIEIDAVLLGRIISLVKKHLDMDKEHIWVVYPRTKPEEESLHVQIVGVWEPSTLSQDEEEFLDRDENEIEAGYFSIRGEVIFFDREKETVIVKIKQFPRKEGDKVKFFKLNLRGVLEGKPLRRFWDFQVRLEGETLEIQDGTDLGLVQKKPRFKRNTGKRFPKPGLQPAKKRSTHSKPILGNRPKPKIKKPNI